MKLARWFILIPYFLVAAMPLAWMGLTSLKQRDDTYSASVRFIPAVQKPDSPTDPRFAAGLSGFRELSQPFAGKTLTFYTYLGNSLLIGGFSTLTAVCLATACAYGFSRFRIAGAQDWLFFILSTRFLPPLAVVVPIYIMYRNEHINLLDSQLGLIILYTAFNLSLAVWLMKGFIDEIPKAYEEAAMVDGYSRLQAFWKIIIPQASTGICVTAVFCLIAVWNEFAFAMTLNGEKGVTVPVYFAGLQGTTQGIPWHQVAAGSLIFVLPIILFTVLVRKHLLRGVTFGTVKG